MSDQAFGSPQNPARTTNPFWRIVEVGWGGPIGILQIDYPAGISFDFEPDEPIGIGGPFDAGSTIPSANYKDSLVGYISLTAPSPVFIRQLYGFTAFLYSINPLESLIWSTDDPPDNLSDLIAANQAAFEAAIAAGPPVYASGTITCVGSQPIYAPPDTPTFIAPTCGGPAMPGATIMEWWVAFQAVSESGRNLVRDFYLFNFKNEKNPIAISNLAPQFDDQLGAFDMTAVLNIWGANTPLMIADDSKSIGPPAPPPPPPIIPPTMPLVSQTATASYYASGTLWTVTKTGFMP
jgi:hypothetical protein